MYTFLVENKIFTEIFVIALEKKCVFTLIRIEKTLDLDP